jgi:hypothetical protein
VVSPRYNEGSFSSRLTHLKAPTPLDRGGISGDLTDFSSTNVALRAVKRTEEGDELHFDLTRHCEESFCNNEYSSSSHLSHLEAPTPLDRGGISGDLTDFSSTNMALRAAKGTEEANELHVELNRHCGESPVTTKAVSHRFYLTWKHPRRWIEVVFQVT